MLAVGAMLAFVVVVLIVWTSIAPELWVKNEYEDPVSTMMSSPHDVMSATTSQTFPLILFFSRHMCRLILPGNSLFTVHLAVNTLRCFLVCCCQHMW